MSIESSPGYDPASEALMPQRKVREVSAELITPAQKLEQELDECDQRYKDLRKEMREMYGKTPFADFMKTADELTSLIIRTRVTERKLGALQHPEVLKRMSKTDILDTLD